MKVNFHFNTIKTDLEKVIKEVKTDLKDDIKEMRNSQRTMTNLLILCNIGVFAVIIPLVLCMIQCIPTIVIECLRSAGYEVMPLKDYLSANPDMAHYQGKLFLVEAHRIRICL